MNDERRINGSIRWRAINSLSIPRDRSIPPQQKSQTPLDYLGHSPLLWPHYNGNCISTLLNSTAAPWGAVVVIVVDMDGWPEK